MSSRYRVIQWATGSVGGEALKGILMHPELEIAGVKVYSDEKAGADAGAASRVDSTAGRGRRFEQRCFG